MLLENASPWSPRGASMTKAIEGDRQELSKILDVHEGKLHLQLDGDRVTVVCVDSYRLTCEECWCKIECCCNRDSLRCRCIEAQKPLHSSFLIEHLCRDCFWRRPQRVDSEDIIDHCHASQPSTPCARSRRYARCGRRAGTRRSSKEFLGENGFEQYSFD